MNRRDLLRSITAIPLVPALQGASALPRNQNIIMTVLGPINPTEMGVTLPHEHLLVDFAGAEVASPDRYNADDVFARTQPFLKQVHDLGCRTLCECTPAYLARDPGLLARLARATGMHLLTNSGYYNANGGKHLPEHARHESARELADRWTAEWEHGIEGTGIRPGFLKIGVDGGPLPEISRTIVRAAAITHLRTGLTIAAHTGDGLAAMEELDVIEAEGVNPSAFIWVHAQNEQETHFHTKAAERGAWVEFDGIGPQSIDRHLDLVRSMNEAGHLNRVLLSHDAGWYHVGEPNGGTFRLFDTLFTEFLPALRREGIAEDELQRLIVEHPAEAFTVRVRMVSA
ncbi:phosphotriesterase family protein [Tautonia rosea]|uniref:phosphotriesterase family protein n=1 Tax=Tautonia rosea TaxID=2728037 RepID=UPI001472B845|nr:phosphotriesterase [Tautonia rosea]